MANKFDDSLFEDVPLQEPKHDEALFEDTLHPEAVAADPVGDATRAMMGGAAGAATGSALDWLGGKAVNGVMNNIGSLDADEIKKIADNADVYRKASPLEDLLDQYKNLGQATRDGGLKHASQAREALKDLPAVPVSEYHKTLAGPALNPKYSVDLPEGMQEKLLTSQMDQAAPAINAEKQKLTGINSDLSNVEQDLNSPYHDERLAINQQAKDKQFNRKMEQLAPNEQLTGVKDKIKAADAEVADATKTLTVKKETRQLHRIDEKLEKLQAKAKVVDSPSVANALDNIKKRKEDFIYNQANRADKNKVVEGANVIKGDAKDAQSAIKNSTYKDQLTFNKILADEKTAQLKNLKQKERLQKLEQQQADLLEQKQKSMDKIKQHTVNAESAAASDFDRVRKTPKEILNVAPELQNKAMGDDYAKSLSDAIEPVKHAEEVTPTRLDQMLQEIRDNVPEGKANTVGKFNADLSSSVRNHLRELSPDQYAPLMDKAAESYKTEGLFDRLGIKYNKDLDRVTLEDSGRKKLNNVLLDPKANKEEYAFLNEALEDAKRQGNLPADAQVPKMLNEAEMAALKNEVQRLRGTKVNAFDINSAVKGDVSRVPGIASKLGGTKLQELFALYKNSKLGNGIKTASKYGFPIAGGLVAGMTAANAVDNGELSPSQGILAGGAEALNPVPFTDVVGGAVDANKAYDDKVSELKTSDDYFNNKGDVSPLEPSLAAAKAGAAGFAKPLTESINSHGFEASNAARSQMEQRMKAADMFKKAEEPEKEGHEEFKSFVEQKPEMLHNLADIFSQDEKLKSFVAPLQKAATSDDRTRSAVLFGLYQQPAFRQALKRKS